MNRDIDDYQRLVDGRIESVASRGNSILVRLDNGMNLFIAPEYGGRILYHESGGAAPEKYHLRIDFTDGTVLTVRITSMGVIQAVDDKGSRTPTSTGGTSPGSSRLRRRTSPSSASPISYPGGASSSNRCSLARTPSLWGSATAPSRTSSTGRGSTRRGGPPSLPGTRCAPSTMR